MSFSQNHSYCAQWTQVLCLVQTQCRLCYLKYRRQGRHSSQGLDSYGFPKWKDSPCQDYSLNCNGFSSDWTLTYSQAYSWQGLFFCCQRFFGQCLHKSCSSTLHLRSRSLVSGRESQVLFYVAHDQLGPQYNFSVAVCLMSRTAHYFMFQDQQKIISLIILPQSTLSQWNIIK